MNAEFTFRTEVGQFTEAPVGLNMHYLLVPKTIVQRIASPLPARFVVTLMNTTWHGAVMSMGDGNGFVMINKQLVRKLGLQLGMKTELHLVEDHSRYGMPMCEELEALLEQDEKANHRFHALTPGRQRNIIHYIGKIKSPQLRIDKALMFMENLKQLPQGKEDIGFIIGARKEPR